MKSDRFTASDLNEKQSYTCVVNEVEQCPICHFSIKAIRLDGFIKYNPLSNSHFYGMYLCPHCHQPFFCHFSNYVDRSYGSDFYFSNLVSVEPQTAPVTYFSDEITALSPAFVETYNQSVIAESNNLTQICGVGYRKSLEFLVKDYLCHKYPDDKDAIFEEYLSRSIKRIEDRRIQTLAERSSWIGNDETHYIKKHEDIGIDEMKTFINAMLRYIESEFAFESAESIPRK